MLRSMSKKLLKLFRNQDAVIAVEFALLLPILLLLCFGMLEVARYVQFNQKMDAGTSQMVNIINQNLNLSLADLNIVMDSTAEIIKPFDGNNFTIVITAIQQNDPIPDSPSDVMWQVGRNLGANPSRVAPNGQYSKVSVPKVTMAHRDQVIVVELFNQYQPLLENGITQGLAASVAGITYKYFIGRPRFGAFQFAPQ